MSDAGDEEIDLATFPTSQKKRAVALALQSVAAVLPAGGGAASTLVSALFPELDKDRIAWLEYLAAKVLQHEDRLGTQEERRNEWHEEQSRVFEQALDELVQRPAFRAAVLRTTDAALRDPLRKKWEALGNIVLHNTLPDPPDDDLQLMFLDYIATFGSWHLYLLKFFDTPRVWPISIAETSGGQVGQLSRSVAPFKVIEIAVPELAQKPEFCMQCVADLVSRGLITLDANKLDYPEPSYPLTFDAVAGRGPNASAARLTSALGKQFLELIADAKPTRNTTPDAQQQRSAGGDPVRGGEDDRDEARIATAITWAQQFPDIPQDLSAADAIIKPRIVTNQAPESGPNGVELLTWTIQEWTVVLGGMWAVDLDSGGVPKGPPWQVQ